MLMPQTLISLLLATAMLIPGWPGRRPVTYIQTATGLLEITRSNELVLRVSRTTPEDTRPRPDLLFYLKFANGKVLAKASSLVGLKVSVDGLTEIEDGERIFNVDQIFKDID